VIDRADALRLEALRKYALRDADAWTANVGALGREPRAYAHLVSCVGNFARAVKAGLEEREADVDPMFRGHGIEGRAMGLALLDGFCGGDRRTRALAEHDGIVRGLSAAGVGMAWARIKGGPAAAPIDPEIARHGYDGLAFARVITEPRIRPSNVARDVPNDAIDDAWRGAGRAYWFLCAGDLDALARALEGLPEAAEEGAGVAAIFSGGSPDNTSFGGERFAAGNELGAALRRATFAAPFR
jgi:hypothetical protein